MIFEKRFRMYNAKICDGLTRAIMYSYKDKKHLFQLLAFLYKKFSKITNSDLTEILIKKVWPSLIYRLVIFLARNKKIMRHFNFFPIL